VALEKNISIAVAHYNSLIKLLSDYNSVYQEEIIYRRQMLGLLELEKDHAFERSCSLGHFTASCWLVDSKQDHYLLLHHKKLNRWLQPGGHCDGDADVLQVAIKEAQEETGIKNITPISTDVFDLDIHYIPSRGEENTHLHFDVRFLLMAETSEISFNHEANDMKWFAKKTSIENDNLSLRRMYEKWRCLIDVV
jgi:8-oxo-dGTP pyrophosphatase MutT (NUDIX family)